MKFLEHPKVGQEVKGYIVEKYISKIIKQTGSKLFYLCLQNGNEKRLLRYNPTTKETSASFERHCSSFGGSSKGSFKTW
jgi:hypothetical protein